VVISLVESGDFHRKTLVRSVVVAWGELEGGVEVTTGLTTVCHSDFLVTRNGQ